MAITITINEEQKVDFKVIPKTIQGNPAELDGAAALTLIEGDATFEQVDDSTFTLISGAPGVTSKFEITGDADLGEGVVPIADIIELTVIHAAAASLDIEFAEPVLK